jgi:hypothetical protein
MLKYLNLIIAQGLIYEAEMNNQEMKANKDNNSTDKGFNE